jgi:hypothetical protein
MKTNISVIYESSKTTLERVQVNDTVLLVIQTTGQISLDATPGLENGQIWDAFTQRLLENHDGGDDGLPQT